MKPRSWFLDPVWRQRIALALIFFGHLVWVFLGKYTDPIWRGTVYFFNQPTIFITEKIETWRFNRLQKIGDINAAQQELELLRAELAELRLERQRDSVHLIEADEAIHLLGLKKSLPFELQTVRVMANNRDAPWGGIIIDSGEDRGLTIDQGIICAEGVVGRIWSVGVSQSLVLPLDAYNASTSVMLARSRAKGVLQGSKWPGLAIIRYISNQEAIQVGEPVYTSGLDQVFPPGMLVGYVSEVSPGPLEMDITVTLAAPFEKLGILFVIPASPALEFNTRLEPPLPISRRGAK
ncbi:MAG: rod shape-determining protein MreC [Holophagaceae bacterium]|nr:rod shape-determining protein MreC [Holophagaceae bacterium]